MTQEIQSHNSQLATRTQALPATLDPEIVSSLVLNGDVSRLKPEQKVQYYIAYCQRVGVDPSTQPFKLLRLNGKEVLYCGRDGAAQLNKLHAVSHEIVAREVVNGCYVVTARASTKDRTETSIGAVSIENLKGEPLCNAMMKAETKAKRRSTLDLLGLGILDDSEAEAGEERPLLTHPSATAPADKAIAPVKTATLEVVSTTEAKSATTNPPSNSPAPAATTEPAPAPKLPTIESWADPKSPRTICDEAVNALTARIGAQLPAALARLEETNWIPPLGGLKNLSPAHAKQIWQNMDKFLARASQSLAAKQTAKA